MDKGSVRVGWALAKNGSACMGTFLGRAPKSLLPAGDSCQFQQLLSFVCSQMCTSPPNLHTSASILIVSLSCCLQWPHFYTLVLFTVHTLAKFENIDEF